MNEYNNIFLTGGRRDGTSRQLSWLAARGTLGRGRRGSSISLQGQPIRRRRIDLRPRSSARLRAYPSLAKANDAPSTVQGGQIIGMLKQQEAGG